MNRIYKVIWSKVKHQYVVVSELAHSNGKQCTSERVSLRASLRAMLAALVVTSSLALAPYTAFAADSYSLQNGENIIVVTNGNLKDYFIEAAQNEDGSYTITLDGNSVSVAEENLYRVGDKVGAFVTPNEDGTKDVYTDDVLDENSTKVVPTKNHVVTNEEGFYVNNGRGTYNTLNKDGLWVGGTNDDEGLHVDDKGNIETTGSAEIDGLLSAADNNFVVDANGNVSTTGYVQAGDVTVNTSGAGTINGLTNTAWNGTNYVSGQAATEDQLKIVSDEAQ
ncbi:ESPR-type extended signal peptide-containing protein, partial [Megasphaera hexanoica]|nr:ESPR-type extended signal peptide-containing protein [Megasphaera hexanoica]